MPEDKDSRVDPDSADEKPIVPTGDRLSTVSSSSASLFRRGLELARSEAGSALARARPSVRLVPVTVWDEYVHDLEAVVAPGGSHLVFRADSAKHHSRNVVVVRNLRTGERRRLTGHGNEITRILITPDGSTVLTSSLDGTVRAWDIETGRCEYSVEGQAFGSDILLTRDGARLVWTTFDNNLQALDIATARIRSALPKP